MYTVGIDVGGTHTDLVLLDTKTGQIQVHKTPTTVEDPSKGAVLTLIEHLKKTGISPNDISYLMHGTTIATNIALEHGGAKTGLITTEGFRDILHMARHKRPQTFSLQLDLPWQKFPLVPRRWRHTIPERMAPPGIVLKPIDEEAVRSATNILIAEGVEAIAICFIHSYLNPDHESRAKKIVQEMAPNIFVTTSYEVTPQSEMTYNLPPEVAGDEKFMSGIADLSEKYNIPQNDILAMMDFETGGTFDPAQKNLGPDGTPETGSGATGLIQFTPKTAEGLGTSTDDLSKMSRSEQLEYVDKHFETNLKGRLGDEGGDISDLYMSVLFPVAVGKPDDFVLFGKGAMEGYTGTAYEQNIGLDANKDGSITKVEAAAKVIKLRDKNVKSDVSSVETSSVDKMTIPSQYMDYDSPMGGEESQSIVMIPPNIEKPQMPLQQAFQPNGSGIQDIIFLPPDTNAMISQLTIQSLGAS